MKDETVSLNKYISNTGMCSRRTADQWIEQGRVLLNGKLARKGNRVHPGDEVIVDGQRIKNKQKQVYIMLNKPEGISCTTDTKDKTNIVDFINFKFRIFPIGRLDKETTGLILLTNDGDIVNRILRKENKNEKEYIVTVNKPITQEFLDRMAQPIPMLGTRTQPPEKIQQLKSAVFRIVLTQGLNRQIRRMCHYCGYKVVGLKRVRIMHLKLGNLALGAWRYLYRDEIEELTRRTDQ